MEKLKNPGHFKTDMTFYKLYFKMCAIYVSCAIYLLMLAILSDIQYELQVKQKITIFLQIYHYDVCMLHCVSVIMAWRN
jgi:hypothetical protein